ncbi:MAG: type II secretion system protein [Sumerlaeia bacterium]
MTRRTRQRAFTLVELVIVGALIALFSGLAIFGVQQQFRSNTRKAMIGETRQLAQALDFAFQDVGFFPVPCFLDDSRTTFELSSQQVFAGDPNRLYLNMGVYDILPLNQIANVRENWRGAYFSASQSRSAVAQGRGGSKKMVLPLVSPDFAFDWPADTYNNPYMIYMLDIDPASTATNPTLRFTENSTQNTGNYVNAVVSYGLNQVPGGGDLFQATGNFDDIADGGPYGLRLYTGNPNNTELPLTYLSPATLTQSAADARANAWTTEFAQNAGIINRLALNNDLNDQVAITDSGSDDVVFSF